MQFICSNYFHASSIAYFHNSKATLTCGKLCIVGGNPWYYEYGTYQLAPWLVSLRTLVMDIEITPHLTYTYDTYEADVVKIVRPQYILSFAYKELGGKNVTVVALPDFKDHYRRKPHSDERLCRELWKILDGADVVIGHNFRQFDMRKIHARFLYWGLPAPSPVQIIDTLQLFRKVADCPGNSMAKLCDYLQIEQPKLHFGIEQWVECIEGNQETWKKEREYQARDVDVNEQIYYKLRSYIPNHVHLEADTINVKCHVCGSMNLRPKGYRYYPGGGRKKRFICKDCGSHTCHYRGVGLTTMRP